MITIFNRKELSVTMNYVQQINVQETLKANGIPYIIRSMNFMDHQMHRGSPSVHHDQMVEYKIFVHKKDYDRAVGLVR